MFETTYNIETKFGVASVVKALLVFENFLLSEDVVARAIKKLPEQEQRELAEFSAKENTVIIVHAKGTSAERGSYNRLDDGTDILRLLIDTRKESLAVGIITHELTHYEDALNGRLTFHEKGWEWDGEFLPHPNTMREYGNLTFEKRARERQYALVEQVTGRSVAWQKRLFSLNVLVVDIILKIRRKSLQDFVTF